MSELDSLLKNLKSWNLHTRTNAARKLKNFRDSRITPALCKALFDFPLQRTLKYWLREWAHVRNYTLPSMYRQQRWENNVLSYSKAIMEALIAQNDPRAVKSLKKLLSNGYHELLDKGFQFGDQEQTLATLAHFEGEEAWQILCDVLIGKYGFDTDTAAELLYQRDNIRATKPLIAGFEFSFMESEWKPYTHQPKLIEILTRIGEPALGDLIEALEHPNNLRRDGAAKTLKRLGDKRAVKPLWQAKDNTPYALVALAHLDYESTVDTLIERLDMNVPRYHFSYLEHIVDILGEHREEKAVSVLASYLEGRNPKMGISYIPHIVIALRKIGTAQAKSAILGWPDFTPHPPFDWFEGN